MDVSLAQQARKATYSDIFLGLLVPALLLKMNNQELALDIVVPSLLLSIIMNNMNSLFILSVGVYTCALIVSLLETASSLRPIFIVGFVFCSTSNMLKLFPHSFTVGEALLISHLFAVFIQTSSLFCVAFLTFFLIERYSVSCSVDSVLSVGCLVAFSVFLMFNLSPTLLTLYKLKARRALCYLSVSNTMLVLFWIALFMACVAILWVYRSTTGEDAIPRLDPDAGGDTDCFKTEIPISSSPHSTDSGESNAERKSESCKRILHSKTPFWMRKVFHFAAGLVYATGLLWSPRLLSLASVGLLLLFIVFEWARRRGPKSISQCLSDLVDPFRDERDSGELIFTPIALLLGLSLPLWWHLFLKEESTIELGQLCAVPKLHPAVWSGVLSVAVGDSLAALVGRAWGRRRWPGTHRTFLGSAASFFSQLVVWMLIAWHEQIHWTSGVLPIVTGVLVEAYLEHIDNLVVPIVLMIAFPNPVAA